MFSMKKPASQTPRPLGLYQGMAVRAAEQVIRQYSSSFTLASRALPAQVRQDIHTLYAMVRIADEIVDGAATQAGMGAHDIALMLDEYEEAVISAPQSTFHTDLILHSYADMARRCGFKQEHIRAFFRSMRADISAVEHTEESLREYIYGSAEVIGLLCLDIFLNDRAVDSAGDTVGGSEIDSLRDSARALGSAFQKINFLRDYAHDQYRLGRRYLCVYGAEFDERAKEKVLAEIHADLECARAGIALLAPRVRCAVLIAWEIFEELAAKIDALSVEELSNRRVRVGAVRKSLIAARVLVTTALR